MLLLDQSQVRHQRMLKLELLLMFQLDQVLFQDLGRKLFHSFQVGLNLKSLNQVGQNMDLVKKGLIFLMSLFLMSQELLKHLVLSDQSLDQDLRHRIYQNKNPRLLKLQVHKIVHRQQLKHLKFGKKTLFVSGQNQHLFLRNLYLIGLMGLGILEQVFLKDQGQVQEKYLFQVGLIGQNLGSLNPSVHI